MTKEDKCIRIGSLIDKLEYALKDVCFADDEAEELLALDRRSEVSGNICNDVSDHISDAIYHLERAVDVLRESLDEEGQ